MVQNNSRGVGGGGGRPAILYRVAFCLAACEKTFFFSRNGLDSCLLYATFETMLDELRCRREINVSNYSRHLATTHDLALSSVDQVIKFI